MFASVSSSSMISSASAALCVQAGMTKMGHIAHLVSGAATGLFKSQAFFVLQTSIDYSILPKLFLYGMFFGAAVTIFCRIFGVEENPIYTRPLMSAGADLLRDISK